MGFFHQLRLLLWKNFTLKKRSPLVVVCEMCIPLVLFVILLLIRKKLPATKMPIAHNHVRALPSTGLLSLIQIFCEGEGQVDQNGFLNFSSDNQLEKLLEQLQTIAEDHDFFRPGMSPQEMDDLPEIYQAVIDDPAFMIDSFRNASDIGFGSLLQDTEKFKNFLVHNLSIPEDEAEMLVESKIHVKEIYHYIFGGTLGVASQNIPPNILHRFRRDADDHQTVSASEKQERQGEPETSGFSGAAENLENVFHSMSSSLLPSSSSSSSSYSLSSLQSSILNAAMGKAIPSMLEEIISRQLSSNPVTSELYQKFFEALTNQIGAERRDKIITDLVLNVMNHLNSAGDLNSSKVMSMMKEWMAGHAESLTPGEELELVKAILEAIEEYKKSIVIQPVWIARAVKSVLLSDQLLRRLACDNDTFIDVVIPTHHINRSLLTDLQYRLCHLTPGQMSQLSNELMQDITDEKIIQLLHIKAINITATAVKISEFLSKAERFMKFQKELEEIYELISLLPFVENMTDIINTTTPLPSNSTPWPDHGGSGQDTGNDDGRMRNGSWKRIWDFLHKAVCGKKPPSQTTHNPNGGGGSDEDSSDIDEDTLGMSQAQKDKLSIIVHYFYNNPAILYAPNGTAADMIIKKANTTIAFIDLISDYAHEWLNISQRLHVYLHKPKTKHNLELMKKMQEDIRDHHSVLSWLFKIYDLSPYLNVKIRSADEYDHQLGLIDYAANGWLRMMKGINLNIFRGFSTEEDMLDYFLNEAYYDNASVIAGVVFQDLPEDGTIPPHISYKIRQNATYLPTTKQVRKPTWTPGPGRGFFPYYQFGFVWVQDMIERAVIDLQVGRDVVEPGVYAREFPYPCYVWDQFMFMIEHVMPLCLTFSWVYSVSMLVQSIVYEKEQRLKEVMKMMGLSNAVHWCAWFLTTFCQMTISVTIMTCVLKMGNVLPNSNVLLIFFVLEVYVCAIITFSFLISVLYSKAKVAAACAGIIYFLSYVPYMYIAIKEDIAEDHISGVWKTLASLFSTTAFGLGAKYFAFYEEMGVGVQWGNINVSPVEHDDYNLLMVILMMLFDCVFYSLLVWYIEHVHPGSYGLPKPWYFPVTKSYWCGTGIHQDHCGYGAGGGSSASGGAGVGGAGGAAGGSGIGSMLAAMCCCGGSHQYSGLSLMEEDQACAMGGYSCTEQAQRFESDPVHLPLGVCIDNLTKVYKLGKKTAVKNLSLNLYEGQITSFLGHNGAGKTTTMSMLTGMIPPTAGTASIYSCDIRSEMDDIRQSLGMCPQHNVLFDKFTVEEHLWFYAKLKGMKPEAIQEETNRMIDDLGLPDKRHTVVDCLSGGMQRKLSVAIAFVGGSRTVILDEPTAGVDPYARRAIWDLLVKFKKGRTILLSTHHMDEADFLGDRIAIISNGQLKCCGTSIFLKNMIGEGYHLRLSKAEPKQPEEDDEEDLPDYEETPSPPTPMANKTKLDSPCRETEVTTFIKKFVSSAYLVSETGRELHYILPFEEVKKGGFEKLFSHLDQSLSVLKVDSYGVMDTNLEEIFLKVTEAAYIEEESGEMEKQMESFPGDRPSSPLQSPVHRPAPPATSFNLNHDLLDVANNAPTGFQTRNIGSVNRTDHHYDDNNDDEDEETRYRSDTAPLLGGGAVVLEDFTLEGQRQQRAAAHNDRRRQAANANGSAESKLEGAANVSNGSSSTLNGNSLVNDTQPPRILLEGRGSHMMHPKLVLLNHFKAVIIKRFHYITRNWRSLFSQIILPAIFVAVAMTVALAAPSVDDMPPLELSPIQYLNVTRPRGNFIPFTNERMSHRSKVNPLDANAYQLQETLAMPSGIGAHCVLRSPDIKTVNGSSCYNDKCRWLIDAHRHMAPDHRHRYDSHYINTSFDPLNPSYSTKKFYPQGCSCKTDGNGFMCQHNDYQKPPGFRAMTLDMLSNITGQRSEDYLLFTTYDTEMHRYGGLSFGLVQKYVPENFGLNAPTLFKKLAVRNVATILFNHKGYHSMGVYLNSLNNAILRANLPTAKGNPAAYGITLFNHPWNDTNSELSSLDYILEGSDVLISIFIIAAMSFVPASFVVFLVYERSTKAKHLQFVTGMNPVMYWIGNYVWDMANYVIPAFMCVMILLIFQIPAYVSSQNLPAVIALFLMYGWSMTPVMYPASFWFKEPSSAYIALIVINLFTGITCIVSSFLLEIFSYDPDLERVHKVLKIVFMMFPNYCLGRGLMELAFNEYRNEYYFKTGQMSRMHSAMEWDLIPCHLVAMASIGLIFFCITLMCEYRFFLNPRQSRVSQQPLTEEDRDVSMERKRVLRGNGKYDSLVLENLTKVYKTRKLGRHLAVDRICLGVPPGECFGLLGVNGAGKTTTFKMLTGDLAPTAGCAYLNGYSVVKDIKKVQQSIGYCPQFDSLYDELTAREHLQLYCRLRGIPPSDEKQVVEWALNKLGLAKYADKLSGTYSGGNKRKLSTAIALIGHPPIIFMDEPTTGMDPHSRRFLWDLILSLIQDGRSVILTSHSMEECEALCTRLAIMVNGKFQCMGSATHLKSRFGDGYTFTIRVKGPDYERARREVTRFVQRHIPQAVVKEEHYNIVQYEWKSRPVSLSLLFATLEKAEGELGVLEDYSVSQNTLDNVFINFVKQQTEIVQDEEGEEESRIRSFSSRLRTRASNLLNQSDEPLLIPSNQSDDSLVDLSDDDVMLSLDDPEGNRLTLMPL